MTGPWTESAGAERGVTTVLVVEPDVLVRMVIAEYLRECGYKVIEAASGEAALAMIEGGAKVDIVFAEIGTGTMDGFALSSKIRQAHAGIDVILTTGIANAAGKAGDLCESGPLEKPYHPAEVVRRINILREQRRMIKE